MKDEHYEKYEKLDQFGKGKMKALLEIDSYCKKESTILQRTLNSLNDEICSPHHHTNLRGQMKALRKLEERIKVKINNLKITEK